LTDARAHTIGKDRELFVDDLLVESMSGLRRVWHPLRKPLAEPVLTPLKPWEGKSVHLNGAAVRDDADGLFKMWYGTGTGCREEWAWRTVICYAESEDGIRWRRPALGIHDFRGETENNIVAVPCRPEGTFWRFGPFSNTINPGDVETPHKALAFSFNAEKHSRDVPHPSGVYLMTSADGLRWEEKREPLWLMADGYGDGPRLTYDAPRKRYIGFLKVYEDEEGRPVRRKAIGGILKSFTRDQNDAWVEIARDPAMRRRRAVTVSEDLIHWTEPRYILPPDEQDKPADQTYTHVGWRYGSLYCGFLSMYHLEDHDPWIAGRQHIEAIYSRDGEHWERPADRVVMLEPGRLDRGWDFGAPFYVSQMPPIRVKDELWFYYNGVNSLHAPFGRREGTVGAVGLATMRVDGFASMDAAASGGALLTVPIQAGQEHLFVNADVARGEIAVEVRDVDGRPVPGFSFADAIPIRKDAARIEAAWKTLSALPMERSVRLAFRLRSASLYSFWTEP